MQSSHGPEQSKSPLEKIMHSAETALLVEQPENPVDRILQSIEAVLQTRKLFIGLDRDGTLVPYSDRPEEARVDAELYALLSNLSKLPAVRVGIISARSIAQLRGDFDSKKLFLAGNYGLEICSPKGEFLIQPMALDAVPSLKEMRDRLASLTSPRINAVLEDHGYSLCLHWHTVAVEERDLVHQKVAELKEHFPLIETHALTTSYEFKPRMLWSKGSALRQIYMQEQADLANAYPIYAGDSEADEPAFDWVNDHGGISIKVGSGDFKTCSKYQLADTVELRKLLTRILSIRQHKDDKA
jgi:trehalose 6-phosphate phosphatase